MTTRKQPTEPPIASLQDLREQLARRAAAAALDPAVDPKLLPQLIGVAAKTLTVAGKDRRPGPSPSPASRDPATEDHPELPPIPEVLPGPPWDPFRDASQEQQEEWNDELIARRSVWLHEQAAELEEILGRPDLIAKVHADLALIRTGGSPDECTALYLAQPEDHLAHPSPSPALRDADATEDRRV
jgi:hypothetical protein